MPQIPKILLLQARVPGDPMQKHELDCFSEQTGIPPDAFKILNLAGDTFDSHHLEGIDAVMVGGSGDFSFVMGGFDWEEAMLELLKDILDRRIPTFGSCFGFQGIICCLGGELERMSGVGEIGTFAVTLTEEGQRDPVFEGFPQEFMAQLGHNDRAVAPLPEQCVHLAGSELAQFQAIRVKGTPVVATQFHPELCRRTNFERFVRYIENYKLPHETIEEATERTSKDYVESPESSTLLRRFMKIELDYEPGESTS